MDECAIYCRVSTDEQAERGTIETQLESCRAYAERNGLYVVYEFKDEGISGATPLGTRPDGKRLISLAECRPRPFATVVVYRVDRIARNARECLLAFHRLNQVGVAVKSVNESLDDTPAGTFSTTIMAAAAQLERDLIRERTSAGRLRRVQKGLYQAPRCPFGYLYNPDTGTLHPHPQNADVLRAIFRWAVSEDLGLKAIAARLDKLGVLPPYANETSSKRRPRFGTWNFGSVAKILRARRYTGQGTYAGTTMNYPPLIDIALFNRTQQALKQRRRDSAKNTRRFYLLQHLLWCRRCGSRLAPRTINAGKEPRYVDIEPGLQAVISRERIVYECYGRRTHGESKLPHIGVRWRFSADELEPVIIDAVDKLVHDPERALARTAATIELIRADIADTPNQVETVEEELNGLTSQETRVLDWAQRGLISDMQLVGRLGDLRAERERLVKHLTELREQQTDAQIVEEACDWWMELFGALPRSSGFFDEETGEHVATLTREKWRPLICSLVSKIWVEPDGTLTLEGPAEQVLANATALHSSR
jgi:site-specific DNA recombinase